MSSKVNATSKAVTTRSNKNILENKQHLASSALPSEGLVLYDNDNTLIEVTVKTKGRKRTSNMVSSSPTSHKGVEEKRRPGSSGDAHQNWGRVLREQNRTAMKQGLQQLARTPGSKSSKLGSETKETKKHSLTHQKQDHKHLDEVPVKQPASHKRMEEHTKSTSRTTNPSSTSIPSSMESVIVYDKGVQCGGISDESDDRFGVFNPVRTLSFLIKELEHLVKDDKANKILNNMEQVLFRIPVEPGKPPIVDLEAMALRTKLEATTFQLEETSRKMNSMCEALRDERDSLQRQVHKHVLLLNEARERQLDLETTVKTLKLELEEAIKTAQTREKAISELTEEIKGYEFSQKVIAELRSNLTEQTELARQRHLEVQYLTLEKDKLSVLSSYKDSLLIELRTAIKELQNHIAEQLNGLKDIYVREQESSNPQISMVHGGIACSSPTSTSSRSSNIPTSWHEISDVSLSTIDDNPSKNRSEQGLPHKPDKISDFLQTQGDNLDKKRTKTTKESETKDSNLEFISLPGGEFSLTHLPSYKDFGYTEMSQSVNKGKDDVAGFSIQKNDNLRNFKSTNKISSLEHLNSSGGKIQEKEGNIKEIGKMKKSCLELNKKQSFGNKSIVTENSSNILKDNSSHNLIGSTITEQFQNIFHDIRIQSRMPVNVPSPPRSYPHPDWSDSTLPSISIASGLNVIQSNDT